MDSDDICVDSIFTKHTKNNLIRFVFVLKYEFYFWIIHGYQHGIPSCISIHGSEPALDAHSLIRIFKSKISTNMIERHWKGVAKKEMAEEYTSHLKDDTF